MAKNLSKYLNLENVVDITVDCLLVIFDTISAPILIPLRIGKHFLKKWLEELVKFFLKKGFIQSRRDERE